MKWIHGIAIVLLLVVACPPFAAALSDDDAFLSDFEEEFAEEFPETEPVHDPIEPFNRTMFAFNDKLYFWAVKPVASAWKAVIPDPARIGVKNVFNNLAAPVRIVNDLLQFKGKAAVRETGKFFVNSIWGFFGLFDAAGQLPSLQVPSEDLGQTLGYWGVGEGFYIVLPFFGPSTVRDTVGLTGDAFLSPIRYADLSAEASVATIAGSTINAVSFRIGDYESIKDASLDPYVAFRDAYLQYRTLQISQ